MGLDVTCGLYTPYPLKMFPCAQQQCTWAIIWCLSVESLRTVENLRALPTLRREDKASWWEPNAHPIPLQVSSTSHPQTGETKACRKSRCNNCLFQARSCQGRKQGSGPGGACNWFLVHHLRLPPDDHENQAGVDHLIQLGLILFWVMGAHSFVFGVQILSRKHVSRRNLKNAQWKIDC